MSDMKTIGSILDANVKKMVKAAEDFPWEDKRAYADLLAQTYWYTRHTTRILGLAGVFFDPSRQSLHQRFMKHSAEETGHDNVAIRDIKNLGFDLSDFQESPSTMALYQTQYFWIHHVDASSIFGYILSLECFAVAKCRWMYEKCASLHGEKSAIFWKVHADDDPDHLEKAIEHVTSMDEKYFNNILVNLVQTAHYYTSIYEEITAAAMTRKQAS